MSRLHRFVDSKEIESRFDILDIIGRYTQLKRKGGYYTGLCPVHQESSPSFSVKGKRFQCYACGFNGSGILDFIMKKENLNFKDALNFLEKDITKPSIKTHIIKKSKPIVPLEIEFVDGKYTDKHLEYWQNFEMDEKFLIGKNVFAVKEWGMGYGSNIKRVPFTKDEIVFAYYAEDIKKVKILRLGPEITPDMKWRNTAPNNYLWYYNDYVNHQCDIGFVIKSVKDCLIMQKTGRCAIATNNESDRILLDNNVDRINNIFKNPVICYGTDPDGKKKSITITNQTGWKWFNMENHLYDQYQVEDLADYLNAGFSYKQLEILLKNKKL